MKRKRNPAKADRDNPAWSKETFERARKARDVLPEIFGQIYGGQDAKATWPTEVRQSTHVHLTPSATGYAGAVEGYRPWVANPNG